MDVDDVAKYCLAKPGAAESYPWGDEELVPKVGGKAFAFVGLTVGSVTLKCGASAEEAGEWRDRYPDAVTASKYIGRFGWNRIALDGTVPDDDLRELIDTSYDAIVAKLPKSKRP